jgi:hypothetical protein
MAIDNEISAHRHVAPTFFALADVVMHLFSNVIVDDDLPGEYPPIRILLPRNTWRHIESEIDSLPPLEYAKFASPIEIVGDGVLAQFRLLETAYIGCRIKDSRRG